MMAGLTAILISAPPFYEQDGPGANKEITNHKNQITKIKSQKSNHKNQISNKFQIINLNNPFHVPGYKR